MWARSAPLEPPAGRAPWRGLPRNVWLLAAASYLRDVASEMLVHLTPLFLANVLGVRLSVVGLIEGTAETTASLTKIAAGWWSDRSGRRKPLTVGGYAVAAIGVPVLALAASGAQVLAARLLDRLGKGIRTAPRDALLADSLDAGRRGAGFGLHRAADTAGAFTGLVLAILIVEWAQQGDALLAESTFRTVALWAVVPAVMAPLVVALGVRERARAGREATRASEGPQTSETARASETEHASEGAHASEGVQTAETAQMSGAASRRTAAALEPRFRRFLVVIVLFTLGNSSDAFLVLRAQSSGAAVVEVLGMLALFNLVYSLLATPLGALSDRVGRRRVIAGGWLVYAGVYLGFGLAGSRPALWALFALYGVYYALTEGVGKALVADVVRPEVRGTAYGLYNAAVGLTLLPASVIAGILWQGVGGWAGFGPQAPFLFGAGLAVAAAGLLWRWV